MISLTHSQDNRTVTTEGIQRLTRAIIVSQGEFSLLLVCCHSTAKQQQTLNLLNEFSPLEITEIELPPSAETLYTTITNILGSTQPKVVIVKGLESVVAINQLIISTNMMRDELRKWFHFPLVLWVNDEILHKLVWLAPDLKSWAACTIRLDLSENQSLKQ